MLLKVNYLIMRYLYFISVLGDLQEGHVYGKRLRGYASRCQFPYFPSTKSGFLCAFGVWNLCFWAFRAQNRGFCALLPFETPVFGRFEHKIEIFVRFCPLGPSFSGISSTKSGFLCSFTNGCWVGALSRRQRHRRTCGAIAPAQPLCHLPLPVAAYRR